MKISKDDFEKKLVSSFPNGYTYTTAEPHGYRVRFSHDMLDFSQSEFQLNSKSILIWYDGEVIKDETGLFIPFTTGNGTYTLPPAHQGYSYQIYRGVGGSIYGTPIGGGGGGSGTSPDTEYKQKRIAKCICGSHSVGSNRHSTWCEIKGEN
jgi:hypothetical protein